MTNKTKPQRITGADYLYLALYAFAGIGLELVLTEVVEPLFGVSIKTYTLAQNILHWAAISVIWLLVGLFLTQLAKKKYNFDLWEKKPPLKAWQWGAAAACLLVSIAAHAADWQGFKPLLEFQKLGALKFAFQYLYYLLEAFLFSLILIFGQKACEVWFKNDKIPYGGILLALTWGLMHIATKGSLAVGLLTAGSGFLYGAAYLFVNRDYRKALPLLCLMFIL